jgi:hypothetical protein
MTEKIATVGEPSTGGDPPLRGGVRQYRSDLPVLRDQPAELSVWLSRCEEKGLEGLRDKSRRSITSSRPRCCHRASQLSIGCRRIVFRFWGWARRGSPR